MIENRNSVHAGRKSVHRSTTSHARRRWSLGIVVLLIALVIGAALVRRGDGAATVRTITLDQVPVDLVVDAHSGHAFVATNPANGSPGSSSMALMLDTTTGALLRSVAIGASPKLALDARAGRVLVGEDTLLAGTGEIGQASTLDARTGALLRTARIGSAFQGMVVDERSGHAFIASYGRGPGPWTAGIVGMVDTRSGRLVRTVAVGAAPSHDLVVDAQAQRAYVQSFQVKTMHRSMLVHQGTLTRVVSLPLVTTLPQITLLDSANGTVVRTFTAGPGRLVLSVDARRRRVFVVNQDANLIQVRDAVSGHLLRLVHVGPFPQTPLVDEPTGRAFVLTDRGIVVLDALTGAMVRTVAHPRAIGPAAIAAHGRRIFLVDKGANSGTLGRSSVSILDGRSGRVLRTVPVGVDPIALAIDERHGHVFVLNGGVTRAVTVSTGPRSVSTTFEAAGPGSVTVLDDMTGTVLRTIAVAAAPVWMDVDTGTGHAVVITAQASGVNGSDPWAWLPGWLRQRLPFPPTPPQRTVAGTVSIIDALH